MCELAIHSFECSLSSTPDRHRSFSHSPSHSLRENSDQRKHRLGRTHPLLFVCFTRSNRTLFASSIFISFYFCSLSLSLHFTHPPTRLHTHIHISIHSLSNIYFFTLSLSLSLTFRQIFTFEKAMCFFVR